jgi:hypothetical protein
LKGRTSPGIKPFFGRIGSDPVFRIPQGKKPDEEIKSAAIPGVFGKRYHH